MASNQKNIQMKNFNGTDWELLFPKTKAELVQEDATKRFTSDEEIAALATKAELEGKADASLLSAYAKNEDIAAKADKAYVDAELVKKADATSLDSKASVSYVDTELAKKANTSDLSTKADASYVDTELGKKADKSELTPITTALDAKAEAATVTALTATVETKASKADLDLKADASVLTNYATVEALSTKADATLLDGKVDKVAGKGLSTMDFTEEEKAKLAGIASNANNYVHPESHPASMITGLHTVATSGNYADLENKPALGTAAAKNVGEAAGDVVVIGQDGKLSSSILPAIAINDTFVVASEEAMVALEAQKGDVAVRTDLSKSFILKDEDASVASSWQELLTPSSAVSSVNGKVGAITLGAADVGLGNVTNESKETMFADAALTGAPTAPTAAEGTNSTHIATTAFVNKAINTATSGLQKLTVGQEVPTAPTNGDVWYEVV